MNGPGTDSLTIRHTPETVPGGARPGWGLPYEQLPAATRTDMTPESTLNEQIAAGRKQIQDQFTLAWDEINRSKRFIGAGKAGRMQQELHAKAKQEMLQFNQQAQQQLSQLRDIDRLVEVGGITDVQAAKIKAGTVYGRETAEAMYPEPRRERTIPQQFSELDVYSHRISQELENFQVIGGGKPSKILSRLGLVSPLAGAVSIYRGLSKAKQKLQIWDPTLPAKVEGEGMGDWRKAEPEEVGIYEAWLQEEKNVAARKRELLGMPDISRRVVQPGTKGGTFSDKIAESVRPQQRQKVIRQRNRRTGEERVSYDGGKTWQTTG